MEVGVTVMVPPEYGSVYEVPLDPVTWIEAALVSVTMRVSDCPEEMLLEPALMAMVGIEAAALAVKTENATRVRRDPKDFISSQDVHSSRLRSGAGCSRSGKSPPRLSRMDGYKGVGCGVKAKGQQTSLLHGSNQGVRKESALDRSGSPDPQMSSLLRHGTAGARDLTEGSTRTPNRMAAPIWERPLCLLRTD